MMPNGNPIINEDNTYKFNYSKTSKVRLGNLNGIYDYTFRK